MTVVSEPPRNGDGSDRERDPRRRLAIQFRAEKKRILATVEQKVAMLERNRKL